ncbi:MAG: hypothetical protein DRJ59_03725 [Thermoprotei archaeon]|nr:MAG: hypothetical protein DRJ59_03725 [Thermoprotei archaeon]
MRELLRVRRSFWDPRVSLPTLLGIAFSLVFLYLLRGTGIVSIVLLTFALYWAFDKLGYTYIVDLEEVKVVREGRVIGEVSLKDIRRMRIRVHGGRPRNLTDLALVSSLLIMERGPGLSFILDIGDIEVLDEEGRKVLKIRGIKVRDFLRALNEALKPLQR